MACPHVTGAAALLWRECRRCENVEIAQCLQKTALDIGPPGRDEEYGYGLIQIESAYDCLVNTVLCCQPSDADLLVDLPVDPEFNEQTGDTESDAPSDPPSDTPSDMPSDIPSDFPTDAPSFAFSGIVPDDLLSSLSVESFDDNELVEDSSSTAWPQTIAASGIVLLSLLIQLA